MKKLALVLALLLVLAGAIRADDARPTKLTPEQAKPTLTERLALDALQREADELNAKVVRVLGEARAARGLGEKDDFRWDGKAFYLVPSPEKKESSK